MANLQLNYLLQVVLYKIFSYVSSPWIIVTSTLLNTDTYRLWVLEANVSDLSLLLCTIKYIFELFDNTLKMYLTITVENNDNFSFSCTHTSSMLYMAQQLLWVTDHDTFRRSVWVHIFINCLFLEKKSFCFTEDVSKCYSFFNKNLKFAI